MFIGFTGNFLFFQDFGLYEDDYETALYPGGRSLLTELSMVPSLLESPPQGRPLLWTLNNVGFNLLWKAKSLSAIYLFVALLTSLNAFLLFVFLRRHVPQTVALAACVFFLLYPADTSKQQLMHWSAHVICSTVVLISLYAHMHAGRIASWIIPSLGAAFCILCYEPYFLLFFAFPLYRTYQKSYLDVRPFLFWIPYLLFLFVITMLWRQSFGEGRVSDLSANLALYLQRAITAPAYGAATVANAMWERPWDVLKHAGAGLWALGLILFLPAYLAARRGLLRSKPADTATETTQCPRQLLFLALAGLVSFLLSYPYRFIDDYFPPNVNMGRFSGMHAVGTFGLCVFFAAGFSWISLSLKCRQRLLQVAGAAVSSYLLLLFMFSLQFQRDQYMRSWTAQKDLWNQIASLCPDMAEVDAVLLNTQINTNPVDALPHTEAFPFYQWNHQTTNALAHFFEVRNNNDFPKLLHFGETARVLEPTEISLRIATNAWRHPSYWPLIKDGSFIELRFQDGRWHRSSNPLVIENLSFEPKLLSESPKPANLKFTDLGKAVLAPDLLSESTWDYKLFGRFYPKK